MSAINFPSNPTIGQTFTSGITIFQWDGVKWKGATPVSSAGGANFIDGGSITESVNTFALVDAGSIV